MTTMGPSDLEGIGQRREEGRELVSKSGAEFEQVLGKVLFLGIVAGTAINHCTSFCYRTFAVIGEFWIDMWRFFFLSFTA